MLLKLWGEGGGEAISPTSKLSSYNPNAKINATHTVNFKSKSNIVSDLFQLQAIKL